MADAWSKARLASKSANHVSKIVLSYNSIEDIRTCECKGAALDFAGNAQDEIHDIAQSIRAVRVCEDCSNQHSRSCGDGDELPCRLGPCSAKMPLEHLYVARVRGIEVGRVDHTLGVDVVRACHCSVSLVA